MSGGSLDYAYIGVQEIADRLRYKNTDAYVDEEDPDEELQTHPNPLRHRLADHIEALSEVLRAIEWSDSGDYGVNDWIEPTSRFLDQRDSG